MSDRVLTKRKKRLKMKKKLKMIQSLFFIVLLVITSFIFLQSSLLNIDKITVQGLRQLDEEEIKVLSNLGIGEHILKVNLEEAKEKITLHPKIKEVELTRKYPREIIIQVEERQGAIIVPYDEGFLKLDGEGVIIEQTMNVGRLKLPIITGLEIKKKDLGIKVKNERLNVALTFLKSMPEGILKQISELNVDNPHQVIIYTTASTQVRLGSPERLDEKVEMLKTVLNNNPDKDIEYIDISYDGPPVFKMRE